MNVTMHLPPVKITGLTWVIEQAGTGPPVLQLCLHGNGTEIPLLVFRDLADLDEWIGGSALAKADFAQSLMRHAARPLVPQDPLTAVVEANARILRERGFYEGGFEPGLIEMAEPLPDLPQREPGVALADIEMPIALAAESAPFEWTVDMDCVEGKHAYAVPSDLPLPGHGAQGDPAPPHPVLGHETAGQGQPDPLAEYQDASNELHYAEADRGVCMSCGAEVDHHLGCPDDPDPDYQAEAELQREQPQPWQQAVAAELSEEALAAHAPLTSLAADPDDDGT